MLDEVGDGDVRAEGDQVSAVIEHESLIVVLEHVRVW